MSVALGLLLHRFRTWIAGEANWRRWLCSFWLQQPAWAAQIVPPEILWFYSLSPENQGSTHQAEGEKPTTHGNVMGYLGKPWMGSSVKPNPWGIYRCAASKMIVLQDIHDQNSTPKWMVKIDQNSIK